MSRVTLITSRWDISIRNEDTVIGHDSECADYSNPAGAIYGLIWYVVATHPDGWRFAHVLSHTTEEAASAQAASILARLEDPAAPNCFWQAIDVTYEEEWAECDPAYGSTAYIEVEAELVAREVAEDMDRC